MLSLDKERMAQGIDVIVKAANTDIIEDINELARVVKSDGDNDMKEKLLEACRKFESVYNDSMKPCIDQTIGVFQGVYEISELLERADVGDLSTVDASFTTKAVDPSSVRI